MEKSGGKNSRFLILSQAFQHLSLNQGIGGPTSLARSPYKQAWKSTFFKHFRKKLICLHNSIFYH